MYNRSNTNTIFTARTIFSFFIFLAISFFCGTVFLTASYAEEAQNMNIAETEEAPVAPVLAKAGNDKNIAVGRNVFFDASASTGPADRLLNYAWDFGDGLKSDGIDATHIYKKPGTYRVTLKVSDGEQQDQDSIIVSVNRDIIVLVTDSTTNPEKIRAYQDFALTQEVLLVNVSVEIKENEYLSASRLATKLLENKDDLRQSDIVLVWTSGNVGLNALTEVGKILIEQSVPEISFSQKGIIAFTDQSLSVTGRIAQSTYNLLIPEYVILASPDSIEKVIEAKTSEKVVGMLSGSRYQLLGVHTQRALSQLGPLNFMSFGVSYLVNRGVSQETIFLILVLPIIATIIAFARQVIGVKALGIYVPSILALAFLAIGIRYGLFIFLLLLLTGTITRLLAGKLRLLYVPRMAMVLTAVSLTIFILFILGAYFQKTALVSISVFPMVMMVVMTEKFIGVQMEKGGKLAIRLTLETLLLSLMSYFIVSWDTLKIFVLGYPEIILITFLLNYIFGKFSGIRILEYIRFRKLLKHGLAQRK